MQETSLPEMRPWQNNIFPFNYLFVSHRVCKVPLQLGEQARGNHNNGDPRIH